uniref:Uncharacterized protein n=1 Tax=Tolypothrix bouteillei VB521301 TaxID=1479485 RepID=A0A0C1NK57_9CYAN
MKDNNFVLTNKIHSDNEPILFELTLLHNLLGEAKAYLCTNHSVEQFTLPQEPKLVGIVVD